MVDINPKIFKAYDLRGIYPSEVNEENFVTIVSAIHKFFSQKLHKSDFTVAVGRDMRLSSPSLFKVIVDTLVSCGANVVDLGLVSTPTFYFAVTHFKYETGIQLTASHNPGNYNGLKFVINTPNGLIKIGKPTGMEDIKAMSLEGLSPPKVTPGSISQNFDIVDKEVENALAIVGEDSFDTFKIVADAANAMAAVYIDALEKKVPMNLIRMNFELDGTFPAHQADPMQKELLVDLQKKVLEEKADFGLAPDGDGDRLFFIDEKGEIVPPTLITSLIASDLLKKHPGSTILVDIRYILTPKKIIEENGGTFDMTKVGHAYITEQMTKTGAIFGGESSAHYFYKATGNAESQLITIAMVMKALTQMKKPLSEVVAAFKRAHESGEINFKVTNAPEILATLKEKYADGELLEIDGVAVSYPNWRFGVRTSNTEPVLRLNIESYDQAEMEQKRDELVQLISSVAHEDTTSGH